MCGEDFVADLPTLRQALDHALRQPFQPSTIALTLMVCTKCGKAWPWTDGVVYCCYDGTRLERRVGEVLA